MDPVPEEIAQSVSDSASARGYSACSSLLDTGWGRLASVVNVGSRSACCQFLAAIPTYIKLETDDVPFRVDVHSPSAAGVEVVPGNARAHLFEAELLLAVAYSGLGCAFPRQAVAARRRWIERLQAVSLEAGVEQRAVGGEELCRA